MSLRAFAALELPPALQEKLAQLQKGLQTALPPRSVRWVRPEGIHLTLRFYGDVAEARLPLLQEGLGRAAAGAAAMQLFVVGAGAFPSVARPTVVWAGVGGDLEALGRIQAAVEKEAARLGFEPDGREYKPHLTLGRVNFELRPADLLRLKDALAQARDTRLGEFKPEHLKLMNSELRTGGSVYSQLYAVPLGAAEQP